MVLCARSINGLAAALSLGESGHAKWLAGVVLIAPVFDLSQVIDRYRRLRGHDLTIDRLRRGLVTEAPESGRRAAGASSSASR